MKKNVLYLIITLVAVILVAMMMNPGAQQDMADAAPESMPSNGLVGEDTDTGEGTDMDAPAAVETDELSGDGLPPVEAPPAVDALDAPASTVSPSDQLGGEAVPAAPADPAAPAPETPAAAPAVPATPAP